MNKQAFLLSQNYRLTGLERVYAPPKLRMLVIDHNKPQKEWPEVGQLTQWDLVIEVEKSPVTT
jgi:hypothetical protein